MIMLMLRKGEVFSIILMRQLRTHLPSHLFFGSMEGRVAHRLDMEQWGRLDPLVSTLILKRSILEGLRGIELQIYCFLNLQLVMLVSLILIPSLAMISPG